MKLLLIGLIALNGYYIHAAVIQTKNYSDVEDYALQSEPNDTLIVTDLDNTVLSPNLTLGSDQWGEYMLRQQLDAKISKADAVKNQVALFTTAQYALPLSRFQTIEKNTGEILTRLKKRNYRIIGLTARPLYLANRTTEILDYLKIEFNRDFNIQLNDDSVRFQQGVYFVGPFNNKGLILKKIIESQTHKFKSVIFIDDKLHHAENVNKELGDNEISVYSLRYGAADDKVNSFNPEVANLEWDFLQKSNKIISDKEALTMIEDLNHQNIYIYKILRESEYQDLLNHKTFAGSPIDLKDGFIHLSTESQWRRVYEKYYHNEERVYLITFELSTLKPNVRWEVASNGDLYPHVYNASLNLEQVVETKLIQK